MSDEEIALGVGLSIGLYVLVCVLIPMAVYGVIMWWKHDPCGLLFGSKEYPVTTENGHKRPARNTVSVELANRGSDHPPVYPMREELAIKSKPPVLEGVEQGLFIYTPHHPPPSSAAAADTNRVTHQSSSSTTNGSSVKNTSDHTDNGSTIVVEIETNTPPDDSNTTAAAGGGSSHPPSSLTANLNEMIRYGV